MTEEMASPPEGRLSKKKKRSAQLGATSFNRLLKEACLVYKGILREPFFLHFCHQICIKLQLEQCNNQGAIARGDYRLNCFVC